jgi:hypothetical protein
MNTKVLILERGSVIAGERKLSKVKLPLEIIVSAALASIIIVSTVLSSAPGSVIISGLGTIVSISPLSVDGKYIEDTLGNVVHLRGVVKNGYEACPGGIWMDTDVMSISQWNPSKCGTELDAMKSWGVNVVRTVITVDLWKNNTGSMRQMYEAFLNLAAQRGMYVVFDGFQVVNYFAGGSQDPLPYPPYATSPGASSVISSQQDFIDWWTHVATELKGYPNVIFELWNEPHGNSAAEASWFNVSQRCINAIRATGATNLILVQWDYACWVNVLYPPPSNPASTMSWISQASYTDPAGNLVYGTHLYYNCIINSTTGNILNYYAYTYSDIDTAFQEMGYYSTAQKYPFFVSEIGCEIAFSGADLREQMAAYTNELSLLNQYGINFAGFWFNDIGTYALENGPPNFTPNQAGQILQKNL